MPGPFPIFGPIKIAKNNWDTWFLWPPMCLHEPCVPVCHNQG